MMRRFSGTLAALCVFTACASPRSEWEDLDYSKVYRAYGGRENDARWQQPSVVHCVDDDLYNCN